MCNLSQLYEQRRSIYQIEKSDDVFEEDIVALVQNCVKYCPSAFNCQAGRAVVLFNQYNQNFWNLVLQKLEQIVPAENFAKTKEKVSAFQNGIGTILFFEDNDVIEKMQKQFDLYKQNFPMWSQQSSGMMQYMIWLALAEKKLGATVQHYNELIEQDIKNELKLPQSWKIICQMPFGKIGAPAQDKTFEDINKRVIVLK